MKREDRAFNELAGYILDSVTIDGATMREALGNPGDLTDELHIHMMKSPTSVRSLVNHLTMNYGLIAYDQDFSFSTPCEEELNRLIGEIQAKTYSIIM